MANPGDQVPPGADYVPRRLDDLQRQIRELGPSIAASLGGTVAHLNSLKTHSVRAANNFNTGTTPGDSTFRWFDNTPPLTLNVSAPTGTILVTAGCGQATLDPGNNSAIAAVSFIATTPLGWSFPLESTDARLFTTTSQRIGAPLVLNFPLTVPTSDVVTITVRFGIWSSSTTTLASAEFTAGYLTAQVIDAS